MNIKIRNGNGVTEIAENKGLWNVKRNGANIPVEKLMQITKIMSKESKGE
jgi:hypothetical protein